MNAGRRLSRARGGAAAMLLAAAAAGAAPAVDVAADPALEARVQALAAELRCLVCQNQSLADSHADLALQLKGQVRDQLRAGRSEADVVDYMTTRYGDFVLYRPPLKPSTLLLWAGPALLLLFGALMLWRGLRHGPETPEGLDLARADALLKGDPAVPPALPAAEATDRAHSAVSEADR
jgi:cytochrome c-type biogenesis protein CcmH